jgi:hypothetical protein
MPELLAGVDTSPISIKLGKEKGPNTTPLLLTPEFPRTASAGIVFREDLF